MSMKWDNDDISETQFIGYQLERIADLLEGLLESTNPLNQAKFSDFPEEKSKQRVFYTDDREEIIDHHLHRLGKRRE